MYYSERLEIRLSAREAQILDNVRGMATRSQWLRAQIAAADTHLHRRGELVRETWEKGSKVKVYACTDCGKEMK